jgi:hypothetical protein
VASDTDDYNDYSVIYYKVKPTRTGVMTVTLEDFDSNWGVSADVKLLNSKKQALSNYVWYDQDSTSNRVKFGVKKNTTYYLKVTEAIGGDNGLYAIKYSVASATDKSLGSKSKAKTLKRKGSMQYSLFVASRSTSTDWYKIKVTSKRQTRIKVDCSGIKSGTVKVSVYCGSKYIGSYTMSARESTPLYITNGTPGKAKAGTYYIKVVKSSKASGKYGIKYMN